MAIDDPVRVVIRQTQEDIEAQSSLPAIASRLALSGTAAFALAKFPFFSQILAALLAGSSTRFEERFMRIVEEFEAEQKRIERKVPNKEYYESEEFQTLLVLLLERLHATHDREKLKMFGDALANSGSAEFEGDNKELFIRTLRDLSLNDLRFLKREDLINWVRYENPADDAHDEEMSDFSRMLGLGLIRDRLISGLDGANHRLFKLSNFGRRFLMFIRSASAE